ncbi:MAG TPA: 4Fe-4S binding protein, partial [Anaerolineae bacterium]|nr:4Fe-4S binding protein [Anaerolineae bacterium]
MALLEINREECIGCGACVDACPFGALRLVDNIAEVDDKCTACGACLEVCPVSALSLPERPQAKEEGLAGYQGVWTWVEQFQGQACSISWEMLGQGRKLADQRKTSLTACVLGHNVEHIGREAIAYGADRVFLVDDATLGVYRTLPYADALVKLVRQFKPEIFLLGASSRGRDLAGSVATELYTGLTADCTGLDIDEQTNLLRQTRPAFGGNIMATIICPNYRPQMSTVRHRVFEMPVADAARQGQIVSVAAGMDEGQIASKVVEYITEQGEVNLA